VTWRRRAALGTLACLAGCSRSSTSQTVPTSTSMSTSTIASTKTNMSTIIDAGRTARLSVDSVARVHFDGCVLVANTAEQRATGLMDRTDLGRYAGMAFAFPTASTGQFWMFQTPMALSIAFVDGSGAVVSSAEMEPCPETDSSKCPRYSSKAPYQLAIEVPRGQLDAMGLAPGAHVSLGGPC
jgi:uncharacterized protein